MSRPQDGMRAPARILLAVAILIAASAVVYFGTVLILAILRARP
ncbi:MAG TPA: hypothetical protein VGX68_20045 [Thermoanaerobaculia bacterium]|jgi:hypothetical protein|nr:hypothetical protein [Thermoanaerobaculia bacterium]